MEKFFAFVFSLLSFATAFADDWQAFPTIAPSSSGVSYTVQLPFIATSSYTTYTILVSDALTNNFSTGYSWTATSGVQIKDGSGNNVCSAATSSSASFGSSVTLYHWQQGCSSGTLTNGSIYTLNVTGNAYCGGTPCATKPPQIMVYESAQ